MPRSELTRGRTGELDLNSRPKYDPERGQAVYQANLRKRGSRGRRVFLSSHVLYEVQRYCDRAAVIREGRLIVEGSTAELDIENRFFDYYEGRLTK